MNKIYYLALIIFAFTLGAAKATEPLELLGLGDYYDTTPDVANCNEGVLKSTEKQKVLTQLNYIRKIHGLKPVTYNSTYDKQCAKAALIIAANESLNHTPPSSVKCYTQDGYDGSGHSNLFITYAYGTNYPTSESSINQWIVDSDVEPCGHRRWLIDPFLKYVAFGRVDGASTQNAGFTVSGMTIWVISDEKDDLSGWDSNFVAYPYHNYPKAFYTDAFGKNWYLSFTAVMDRSNYWNNQKVGYSGATVTMTDESGNSVAVNSLQSENDGYGVPNLLKWKVATLTPEVRYNVVVKNVDFSGVKKNFSYWFKVTDQAPAGDPPASAPTLASPNNNATNVDINPTLTWNSLSDATTYNIQVSTASDFSTGLIEINDVTLLLTKPNLAEKTKYYWRVCGANQYGKGPWSASRAFTTISLPYTKPVVLLPADGATNVSETTDFMWNTVQSANAYTIQFSKTNDFAVVAYEEKGISSTLWHLPSGKLDGATMYFWKIRATGTSGAGAWSDIRSFWSADPSSVNDFTAQGSMLNVFPNPAGNTLNLNYRVTGNENLSISIYDALGQKVLDLMSGVTPAGDYSGFVNISALPQGPYIIRMNSGNMVITRMVTKVN